MTMTEVHRQGAVAEPAVVRRFFLDGILGELGRETAAYRSLTGQYGIATKPADHPYATVPLRTYIALFEDAAERLGRPYLGCELGQAFRLWEIGPVYPLLATAPTLRVALDVFARFQAAWQSHTTLSIQTSFERTTYSYMIDDPRIWPRRQDAEFAIAGLCSFIRQLLWERWAPVEVTFEHDLTGRTDYLRSFFRCPIQGTSGANAIVLHACDLDRPVDRWLRDDARARAVVERHLSDLLRPPSESALPLQDQVAEVIAKRLGRASTDLDSVAEELGIVPRTLRRQLRNCGTSFSGILNWERQKKAENLLLGGTIKLQRLALLLGYTNQAAFSRAFREWTGETPSAARRRARSSAAASTAEPESA